MWSHLALGTTFLGLNQGLGHILLADGDSNQVKSDR